MSLFQWCLPPGSQLIQHKQHHSWSAGKFPVFSEFQTFEKVKIQFEKKKIIIFKKVQNIEIPYSISSVQFSRSVVSDSATPCIAARQASLSFTISQSLLKFLSIESVIPSNHLTHGRPLFLLLSIFPSLRILSNESTLHIRWPKCWSFSFSISPSNENSGWFPLGLTGLTSLQSKGLSRVFSNTTVWKLSIL